MKRPSRHDGPGASSDDDLLIGRAQAIARAIGAVPPRTHGIRLWIRVDAVRRDDHWACLLEDDRCRYVLTVHGHTAAVHISTVAWLQPPGRGPTHPRIATRTSICHLPQH